MSTPSVISFPTELLVRRALRGSAKRYLDSLARGTSSDYNLSALLGTWVAWVQTAIDAGLTPAEIGAAAGLVDDVGVELAHRLERAS